MGPLDGPVEVILRLWEELLDNTEQATDWLNNLVYEINVNSGTTCWMSVEKSQFPAISHF